MIFVAGCILTNVLLLIWLRFWQAPLLTLITLNYFVCVGLAEFIEPLSLSSLQKLSPLSLLVLGIQGILFISVFLLTGKAVRNIGVGLTGMLTKLSVILPIGFAALFLKERLTERQVAGLLIGVAAIILVHAPYLRAGGLPHLLRFARVGFILWIGNGVIDILFKAFYPTWHPLSPLQIPLCIMSVAGLLGILLHTVRNQFPSLFQTKVWLGALILGAINLLSIFFYLKALNTLPAVQFFLWNNLGIILLSGIVGIAFFKEKLSWEVGIGYALGVGAIFLTA
ncbi:MAG: DMT family transporter [Bacteroidia bacterium]|nr:DMT family transporter [Bacteroidia bacterium]MDW8015121.1 DMT family transporter [Bacteroidia bacterium]